MLSMRKIMAFTVVGAAVLVSVWVIGSRVERSRRDSAYQTAFDKFQHDLPIGTARAEVKKYLDSRNIQYYVAKQGGNWVQAYEIKIGEDPGGVVCEPWDVYVALEFSPDEVLKQVRIRKSGTCL